MCSLVKLREEWTTCLSRLLLDIPMDVIRIIVSYQEYTVESIQKTDIDSPFKLNLTRSEKQGIRITRYKDMIVCSINGDITFYNTNNQVIKSFCIPDSYTNYISIIGDEIYSAGSVFDMDGKQLRSFALNSHIIKCDDNYILSIEDQDGTDDDGDIDVFIVVCDRNGKVIHRHKHVGFEYGLLHYNGVCYMLSSFDEDNEQSLVLLTIDKQGKVINEMYLENDLKRKTPEPLFIQGFHIHEYHLFICDKYGIYVYAMNGRLLCHYDTSIGNPCHEHMGFFGNKWLYVDVEKDKLDILFT